jgi:heme exporter protein CcmD
VNDFLAMGGYAQYVWPAYIVSLIVLGCAVWMTKRNYSQTRQRILKRVRSQEGNQQ